MPVDSPPFATVKVSVFHHLSDSSRCNLQLSTHKLSARLCTGDVIFLSQDEKSLRVIQVLIYSDKIDMAASSSARLSCIVVGLLFLVLITEHSSAESEVKDSPLTVDPNTVPVKLNTTSSQNVKTGDSKTNLESKTSDSVNNDGGDQVERSKEVTVPKDSGKENSSQSESLETKADGKEILAGNDGEGLKGGVKEKQKHVDEKKESNDVTKKKVKSRKIGKEGRQEDGKESDTKLENQGNDRSSSLIVESVEKEKKEEKLRVEACDSSYMCVDEKRNLVACLRVPGNDSPDLSLLIQNMAKRPLRIKISAPASVLLEKTEVVLDAKEDRKVKVSLGENDGTNSLIVLTSQDGRCTLDYKELLQHESQTEQNHAYKPTYFRKITRPHLYVAFISMTALLLIASAWACIGLRRKYILGKTYQPLDTEKEVPVASSKAMSKATEAESKDQGWDDNWDDNWDVEEAPMTPTLPVTPRVSSRGLASRRLNKEKDGWKD